MWKQDKYISGCSSAEQLWSPSAHLQLADEVVAVLQPALRRRAVQGQLLGDRVPTGQQALLVGLCCQLRQHGHCAQTQAESQTSL